MRILTFDIGGANVKRLLYDSRREGVKSDIFYFPIWKRKDELSEFLRRKSIRADAIGVTMTAELSDAFADKASGVMYIVDACENSLGSPWYLTLDGRVIGKEGI
ncbi:MAG: H4MPT-linked C1 transfer pathway protein, partial [Candidatus Hydrothermarchaeota archaeon]|nr:H4MPT-linked C1 transfer pathway protein [Candidatus Hydrothermarchaeota archaeon]